MSDTDARASRLPPRRLIRPLWAGHRAVYRITGRRVGLWRTRTGRDRRAIVAHVEDAMNGWADPRRAWWRN
ncbi:MAG: nitroreductase family deazaflavin-dependent oxidoreductase, partial [Thermoleophilia bacterium]|nr:nitroreductase family deazaflavin-dependent oxidoreductase [Thermoleophilia bacterium]